MTLYEDNFNRKNSDKVSSDNNTWYGHQDSNTFEDIAIKNNQAKIGAQDPKGTGGSGTNSSWIYHLITIPNSYTGVVSLTLDFDFVGLNSYNDDFLTVSWGYGTPSAGEHPLDHILQPPPGGVDHYVLGDNTNSTHGSFTFDFDTAVNSVLAIEFLVDVDGCPTCNHKKKKSWEPPTDYFEGILLDNVKLVLKSRLSARRPTPGCAATGFASAVCRWPRRNRAAGPA